MAGPNYTLIPGDWSYLEYVINDLCSRIIDEDTSFTDYILKDGSRAFTGVVSGITPTANAHLSTKAYVDTAVAGNYCFKTITGITNDVVADSAADTLTLASANARLTIVGTTATDTITFTTDTDLHNYSWTNVNGTDLKTGSVTQAYSAYLAAIAGLTPTDSNFIVGNGSTWVAETGATARTSLGLGTIATYAGNQNLATTNNPTFAGATISNTNKLYFGNTGSYIYYDGDMLQIYDDSGWIGFTGIPQFYSGLCIGIDSWKITDSGSHGGFGFTDGPGDPLPIDAKSFYSNQIEDTDFDLDEVLSIGVGTGGYGLLVIRESTGGFDGVFLISYTNAPVQIAVSTGGIFSLAKDNAGTINVYFNVNDIKVQNKRGNNQNVRVGFFGV